MLCGAEGSKATGLNGRVIRGTTQKGLEIVPWRLTLRHGTASAARSFRPSISRQAQLEGRQAP